MLLQSALKSDIGSEESVLLTALPQIDHYYSSLPQTMAYESINIRLYDHLFDRAERSALESHIYALSNFHAYHLSDGMPVWYRVHKAMLYAMCAFLLKKLKSGLQLVEWARREWEVDGSLQWVQESHKGSIRALEHDFQHWSQVCRKGQPSFDWGLE